MIKYLTGKELCEALGISTTLLYKFRKAGIIKKRFGQSNQEGG